MKIELQEFTSKRVSISHEKFLVRIYFKTTWQENGRDECMMQVHTFKV